MSVSELILCIQINTSQHPVFLMSYEQEENDCLRCASVIIVTRQSRCPPRLPWKPADLFKHAGGGCQVSFLFCLTSQELQLCKLCILGPLNDFIFTEEGTLRNFADEYPSLLVSEVAMMSFVLPCTYC